MSNKDERTQERIKVMREQALEWRDWLIDFPLGKEVSFLGNVAWVYLSHSFPDEIEMYDPAFSPCEPGSIELAWRHDGLVRTHRFTILHQAKALIRPTP